MGWLVEKPPSARAPRRWVAYYRDAQGVTRSAGTFAVRREAKAELARQEAALADGKWRSPVRRNTTVADWAATWQASRRKTGNTAAKVDTALRVHILPKWGERLLTEVTPLEVRGWVTDLQERYTADTVQTYLSVFKTLFNAAIEEEVFDGRNPVRLQRGDIAPAIENKDVVLTPEQIGHLIAWAPARYRALIHLTTWTGMRWGEVVALRWTDIDLEAGVIRLERAQVEVAGKLSYGPPKSGKSRTFAIDPGTVKVLREHRRDWPQAGMGRKGPLAPERLVFSAPRGGPLYATSFRKRVWNPLVQQLGLDPAPTFHDLRHTHITTLLAQGVDVATVAKRVGHSKATMTMRYAHARPDDGTVLAAIQSAMGQAPAVHPLPNRDSLGQWSATTKP